MKNNPDISRQAVIHVTALTALGSRLEVLLRARKVAPRPEVHLKTAKRSGVVARLEDSQKGLLGGLGIASIAVGIIGAPDPEVLADGAVVASLDASTLERLSSLA